MNPLKWKREHQLALAIANPLEDDGFCRRVARRPRHAALPMGCVDAVLSTSFQYRMSGDEPARVQNADLIRELVHLDDAPGPVRDTVVYNDNLVGMYKCKYK